MPIEALAKTSKCYDVTAAVRTRFVTISDRLRRSPSSCFSLSLRQSVSTFPSSKSLHILRRQSLLFTSSKSLHILRRRPRRFCSIRRLSCHDFNRFFHRDSSVPKQRMRDLNITDHSSANFVVFKSTKRVYFAMTRNLWLTTLWL